MTPDARRAELAALDKESPLLSNEPPHWVIRGTAYLVIALAAIALAAAVFIKLPETVTFPGLIVPDGAADPIQAPRAAVIREVRVSEGLTVAKGDELYVLASEAVGDRDAEARTLAEDLASRERDLKNSELTDASDLDIKDHEIAQADEELKFLQRNVEVERDFASRVEKLAKVGIYAETDVIARRLEVAGAEKDLNNAARTRELVVLQRQQLAEEHARRRTDDEGEIAKLRIRLEAAHGQLENSSRSLSSIRAPYDAVVIAVAATSAGSVVQGGQELCQLARTGGKPKLRLLLSETGLARLRVGQRLRFFADAFPYQRYGTLAGTLAWISPSAVTSREGPQFVAVATLDRDAFLVGEQDARLRAGMRGEARVIVGSRTPFESVLEPVRRFGEDLGHPAP